jgi:hypothetical protein
VRGLDRPREKISADGELRIRGNRRGLADLDDTDLFGLGAGRLLFVLALVVIVRDLEPTAVFVRIRRLASP